MNIGRQVGVSDCYPDVEGSHACFDTKANERQEKNEVCSTRVDSVTYVPKDTHIESHLPVRSS